jgi:ABC-2 type transport system ATP-binding protein
MDTIVETRGLTKRFGRVVALNGLNLTVSAGDVHGCLGPNGAGKSTTIRVLLGLARASSGEATVFGANPWDNAVELHRRIAYVPGDVNLWPNLTGGEAIDLISRLRGGALDKAAYATRRAQLIDIFQLDPSRKGRAYSKGNRQKVALIAALATPAELYILDEPTSGLDPIMETVFNEEIRAASASGATVLLSSHILSEVEQLCNRVSIIRAGQCVESGTLGELRRLTRTEVSFLSEGTSAAQVAALPAVADVHTAGARIHLTIEGEKLPALLPALAALNVQGLTIAPPSLEELFLRHYGDELAAAEAAERGARRAAAQAQGKPSEGAKTR